jgi:calcium-dependent protein kinase
MFGCIPFLCGASTHASTSQHRYWIPANLRGNMVKIKKSKIETEYKIFLDQELGKGGCGVVVYGENKKTSAKYAIKIVEKKDIERVRFDREVKLLKDFDHINIVRLFSVYDSNAKFYFVMELCTGGHLGGFIERQHEGYIPEAKAKPLFRQLMSAIAHMHDRGIAHRDIKLQNILLDQITDIANMQLKVIDFGFGSKFIGALPMRSHVGTLYTTAPEVIRENYDERCDVWSAGVVLYIMLSGKRPFETYDTKGVLEKAGKATIITNILAGRFAFYHPAWKKVSKVGINFVKDLLHPDYTTRMRSADVLEHQWFDTKKGAIVAATPSSLKAVSNMKKLLKNDENILQTGMMAAVFAMNTTPAQDLRTVFQSFDKDASGGVSYNEFAAGLKALAPELSETDVDRLFNCIDIDKNGTISYTEFLTATLVRQRVVPTISYSHLKCDNVVPHINSLLMCDNVVPHINSLLMCDMLFHILTHY